VTGLIAWGLLGFLLLSLLLSIRRAVRGTARPRTLLLDALSILLLAVLVGGLGTMSWNILLPVAMWWVVAALLGVLAGVVTWRILHVGPSV